MKQKNLTILKLVEDFIADGYIEPGKEGEGEKSGW
jgi:hypothetical protein